MPRCKIKKKKFEIKLTPHDLTSVNSIPTIIYLSILCTVKIYLLLSFIQYEYSHFQKKKKNILKMLFHFLLFFFYSSVLLSPVLTRRYWGIKFLVGVYNSNIKNIFSFFNIEEMSQLICVVVWHTRSRYFILYSWTYLHTILFHRWEDTI